MTWRNVIISNPAKLSCKDGALMVTQEGRYKVPLEDISSIILDNPQIVITQPVLSSCAEYGIGVYSTDQKHIPNGVFLPFNTHNSPLKLLSLQLSCSKPVIKRLWSEIIKCKIMNQARTLDLSNCPNFKALEVLSLKVRSGDSNNIEARAAAFYFKNLFSKDFTRSFSDNNINGCLNYGYAVFRGEIARRLVAHGLHPPIGIFHSNQRNAFNLADDLLEPFRPIVDLYVKRTEHVNIESNYLPKAELVSLLNYEVVMPTGKMAVSLAMEYLIESYTRILAGKGDKLDLPKIETLKIHEYDENML